MLGVLLICSCTQNSRLNEQDKTRVSAEVRKTLLQYCEDVKTSGLMAEFKYLDSSKDFFWVPPGFYRELSYDSVAGILRKTAPGCRSIHNTFDRLTIFPLRNDLASYTARIHSEMIDTSGATHRNCLVESGLMIRRKDGWRLFQGQTSAYYKCQE